MFLIRTKQYPMILVVSWWSTIFFGGVAISEEVSNDDFNDDHNDDETTHTDDDVVSNEDEWYMIVLVSLVFAYFITFFGSFIGYWSYVEDKLMMYYQDEGDVVIGDVIDAQYCTKQQNNTVVDNSNNKDDGHIRKQLLLCESSKGKTSKEGDQLDYLLTVEYNTTIVDNYYSRIRKQIKATSSDLIVFNNSKISKNNLNNEENIANNTTSSNTEKQEQQQQQKQLPTTPQQSLAVGDPTKDLLFCNSNSKVELYLLPNHPKSGLGKNQVDKACSLKQRFLSVAYVLLIFAIGILCTLFAIREVIFMDKEHQRHGMVSIIICVLMIILQIPLIHMYLQNFFVSALDEEYVESGDYIPKLPNYNNNDDAMSCYSFATSCYSGSGSYLAMMT